MDEPNTISDDKQASQARNRLDMLIDAGYGMCALASSQAHSHGQTQPEVIDQLNTIYREIYFRVLTEMKEKPILCEPQIGDHNSLIIAFCELVGTMQKAGFYPLSREEMKIE